MATIVFIAVLLPFQLVETQTELRLDTLLRDWDKANRNVSQYRYVLEQTTENGFLRVKEVRRADVWGKKPDLARIDWKDENDTPTEIWLRKEKDFVQYRYQDQDKITWQLAPGFPEDYLNRDWRVNWTARLFLWGKQVLCFEFPVHEIKQHFEVYLKKEDRHWAYLRLVPKTTEYWPTFRDIEVVLDQKTHLVRQYRFLEHDWVIYDFKEVEISPDSKLTIDSLSMTLPRFKEIRIPSAKSEPKLKQADSQARQP
jgi:hypothetical protein